MIPREPRTEKSTRSRKPSGASWGGKLLAVGVLILSVAVLFQTLTIIWPDHAPANVQGLAVKGPQLAAQTPAKSTHDSWFVNIVRNGWSAASGWATTSARLDPVSGNASQTSTSTSPSLDVRLETSGNAQPAASDTSVDTNDPSQPQLILAKLSPELRGVDPNRTLDVIVQFKNVPSEAEHQLVQAQGGSQKAELHFVKADVFRVKAGALSNLASDPRVAYISPDRKVGKSLDHVSQAVNADIAWSYGWDGSGIGVAVIDSGISAHPDLNASGLQTSRVVYSESFVAGNTSTSDAYGHGTHVGGIIAGNAQGSANYRGTYRGMAPNAQLINLRALDQDGSGTDSSVIVAIQRAIQLKDTYNIRVINLSLGRGVYESYQLDPLCQAVEAAWKSGIVVVVAAGNSGRDNSLGTHGYGTIAVPANDPYVITVGATNMKNTFSRADDVVTSYSSKGPTLIDHVVKPDLVAPGNRIVSLISPGSKLARLNPRSDVFPCDGTLTQCSSSLGSPAYFRLSGTSMATPVVSGAVALLLQSQPGLTPDQVKARLMKTAWKGFSQYATATDAVGTNYSLQSDIFAVGAGYLDVAAALANTDVAPATPGSAKSPLAVFNPASHTVSIVQDSAVIWGGSVMWGTSVVWGTSVLWGTDIITGRAVLWGSSVVWGSSTDLGFGVLWGDAVLWGDSTFQALSDGDDGDTDSIP